MNKGIVLCNVFFVKLEIRRKLINIFRDLSFYMILINNDANLFFSKYE